MRPPTATGSNRSGASSARTNRTTPPWNTASKLLGELGELKPRRGLLPHPQPAGHRRRGTPALKWGSTGCYSEDGRGRPVYDWTIVDRIFDTYLENGVRPYVQIGFMPEALSIKPVALSPPLEAGGEIRRDLHRLGLPAEGLREVGGTRLSVGEPLRRRNTARRKSKLVLGNLERAEHRLLARRPGGVLQAARPRLHGVRPRLPERQGRRPRRRRRLGGDYLKAFLEHCLEAPTTPPAKSARRSTSSRFTPRAPRNTSTAMCAWGSPTNSATSTAPSA